MSLDVCRDGALMRGLLWIFLVDFSLVITTCKPKSEFLTVLLYHFPYIVKVISSISNYILTPKKIQSF